MLYQAKFPKYIIIIISMLYFKDELSQFRQLPRGSYIIRSIPYLLDLFFAYT